MEPFSEREMVIVQLMLTVMNPLIRDKDFETIEQLLKQSLKIRNIEKSDQELKEIIGMVNEESKFTISRLFGFIQKSGIDLSKLKLR